MTSAWTLGWAPLRNTLRGAIYTRRGPDRPRRVPPPHFLIKLLVGAAFVLVLPILLAGPVRSALLSGGASPAALMPFAWTVLCGLSLLFGFIAALGLSLPAALAMDHLLRSLPVPRRTHVAARLLGLQLEGLFWTLLFAYPLVLHAVAVQRGGLPAQLAGLTASAIVCIGMVSVGAAAAHALLVLLPRASRTRLLVNALLVTIAGVGLGGIAAVARGGILDIALRLSTVPFSPTWLPQAIVAAVASHAFGRAAQLAGALTLATVAAAALGRAAMHLSYDRVSLLEES